MAQPDRDSVATDTGSPLGADEIRRSVAVYRDLLRSHQEAINRLNVYPVPDGDTGTNMALTLESVVSEVGSNEGMPSVCQAVSHGSLMGARGNSGVILSQILRGLADSWKDHESVDAPALAAGLEAAATAAYSAVMRPVEGTILTVVREAAAAATQTASEECTLVDVLDAARDRAGRALEQTPELLPVLKQAGVVDAGGAGFLLLLDALLHVVAGRALPEPPEGKGADLDSLIVQAHGPGEDVGELRYEVMYLLEAPDETISRFKEVWAGMGDSIVVVGGDGLWNCHIHTDDIGAAIEAALDCGRPKRIRVTDLHEQVEEERWVREAEAAVADEPEPEPVRCGVVAVATGDGIGRIFRSLGVQRLVAGGQSMNPSTAQILEAVEAVAADDVVVLPNNKNIIPVAEQVAPLTAKTVRVVRTTGIPEGFGALLDYDPDADAEENADRMAAAAASIVTGEVTKSVRASRTEAGDVTEGDYLGLSAGRIRVIRPDLAPAAAALLDEIVTDEHEMVTIIEGDGASAATTRRITEWLAEHRPAVDTEVHHGGQPLYPYLFSVE